ncbi:MAG TPA: hypothetical protein VLD57_01985, partial [Blastocatellia bacterium]|nr:hypothetical protein [Blastocatellia bacterium]
MKRLNIALMFVLMLGIGMTASVPAQAQYRDYDRNRQQSRWNERLTKEVGFMVGYLRAYTDGRQLLRYGYRADYDDMANYRNDSMGWMSKMHYRDQYRQAYRNGYQLGFREAQANRRPRYDRRDLERLLNESITSAYGRDILAEENNWNDWRDGRRNDRDDRWNDRYGRYDRNEVIRIAQQNGYREGQQHGNQDRARRRGYD